MPDITMCEGEGCKIKQSCFRFTAKREHYQSYFVDSPLEPDGSCKHFMFDNYSPKLYGKKKYVLEGSWL